jgi:hypothetical protein
MAGYHEKVGQTAFFEKPILRKQPKTPTGEKLLGKY